MKKHAFRTSIFLLLSFSIIFLFAGVKKKSPNGIPPYKNSALPVKDRVQDLLNKLTLKEKIDLLGGTGFTTKPIKRLGIPELKMTDGPLGVRWQKSTAFPAGIAMASSWDTSLVNKVGSAIGREVKSKGRDVILGPCVNIARIPMGGRNFESFGEDPFLDSRMAVSYIKGVQKENVASTVKHFAANNQEYQRMFVNVKVSKRALNEIYLPAFKAAVKEAHVLAIMAAYNKVNGTYCSENDYLLKKKLREDWGFQGLAMSDWGAVHNSIQTAKSALDLEMPTGYYMNDSTLYKAVKNGTVKESIINKKVRDILTVIFKLGLFDHPRKENPKLLNSKENREIAYRTALEGIVLLKNKNSVLPVNQDKIKSIAVIGPNAAVARTGGGGSSHVTPIYSVSPLEALRKKLNGKIKINYAQGIVFSDQSNPVPPEYLILPSGNGHGLKAEYFSNQELKGKPELTRTDKDINYNWGHGSPAEGLPKDHFSVRWTGFLQVPKTGDYTLSITSDDGARFYLNGRELVNDWNNHAPETHLNTVKLKAGEKNKITVEYFDNTGGASVKFGLVSKNKDTINEAVESASKSDVSVLFVGTNDNIEGEGHDRKNLELSDMQDELINAVAKVNKHVIVVITSGSPVLMDKWINNVDGVIESWFAGDEIGNAIADVLLGNYNPSGKLPITFPKRWEDCSAYKTYKVLDSVSDYSDGLFVGYRHFDENKIEPLFPFGYGLSYTTFEYSNIRIKNESEGKQIGYTVTCDIKNTGKRDGAEIAQLYLSAVNSKISRPPKELKGFSRVELAPGELKTVKFILNNNAFEYYDAGGDTWKVAPGEYKILVGSSSRNIKLQGNVNIK